jgi:hypothetical protein
VQAALVAFDAQDVVAALFNDFAGDGALGSHGVDGDHGTLEVEHFEQFGNGGDLVGFLADERLCQGDSRLAGPCAHRVQMGGFAAAAASQGLAVDGNLAALHDEAERPRCSAMHAANAVGSMAWKTREKVL